MEQQRAGRLTALSRHTAVLDAFASHFGEGRLGRQLGWIAAPFALQQVIRLATNVVLTHLLAPQMFGLMMVVNTLRTGTELLSDIGVGQSVVRAQQGDTRPFLDTAWTVQLLRGVVLALIAAIAAGPVGAIYGQPELTPILLTITPLFLLTGLQSPGLFLMQRNMQLGSRAVYDLGCTVFQCAFTILLASVMPTVWALVWGLLASAAFSTMLSYLIGSRYVPRLCWDRSALKELVSFGKWVFLATALYFAATSTDKIYFVAVLPLVLAGVYAVARTFADLFDQLSQRAAAMIVFPRLARLGTDRAGESARLRAKRRLLLAGLATALAAFIASADMLIVVLYDDRYRLAGFILPLLLAGSWFRMLGSLGESMLMGCGRPAPGALANAAKFAVLLVGLPLAIAQAGLLAALFVLIAAEAARWLVLAPLIHQERLASPLDDAALTLLLAGLTVGFKLALGATGLVPTAAEWWALGASLHG